jgi:hypothetical protein
VLLIIASGVVGVVGVPFGDPTVARWHNAGELEAPPAADASSAEWNAWARRAVETAVNGQAVALLAGDQAGYLAAVDPGEGDLRSDLQRRFEVLRQMGVGQWSQAVRGRPLVTGELSWRADISVTYCFGEPNCRPNAVVFGSDWRLAGDRIVMTDVDYSGEEQVGPRPWETTDLAVATGSRTVVATSRRLERRLDETLAAAEHAAVVADSLARWDGPPSRYVVFLAGASDWDRWYGFEKPDWSGGLYVDQTDNEVVVNAAVRDPQDMLTHEFTHVATLAGPRDGRTSSTWWLVEGIAEYATMLGKPVAEYDAIGHVRDFVAGSWDGDPVVDVPSFEATLDDAAARYGVAFLAVRRMADVYGEAAMVEFFGAVVHHDLSLDAASRSAFEQTWAAVRADCETYIRDA